MKTFAVVIVLMCIICLTGCHPKKMRPLEPPEEEEVGKPGREPKKPGWEREETEEPLRPIQPIEGEETVLEDIHFEFDKYNLSSQATRILGENAETLMRQHGVRILIEGHCDDRGTDEYNLALGEKRALAARDFLVRFGIDKSRISVISYGEERPLDPEHSEEAWAKNRRAHFAIK
jgi:peptidoglycan-associated lipoprotein